MTPTTAHKGHNPKGSTMNNHTTQDVLAKLRELNERNMALLAPLQADEHDWDSYDSSDHNMRQQEWEQQAREVAFIEFHIPAKLPINEAQLIAANKAIEAKFSGVRLGASLSQRKACEILASYIGLDDAAKLMASA